MGSPVCSADHMKCIALWCALVSMVAACRPERESPTSVPRWPVDSVPLLDIAATGPNGEVRLERPVGATRLSDGTIAVGDATARSVAFFDPRGRLLGRTGREGQGPGEVRSIRWIGQCAPDSVFAWDAAQGRMTVMDGAGTVAREYPLARAFQVACIRGGLFVLVRWPEHDVITVNGVVKRAAPLMLVDPAGTVIRAIATIPLYEAAVFPPLPLHPATSVAASRALVYVGTQDSAVVDAYTPDGRLAAALPQADVRRRARQQIIEQTSMPDLLPPYADVFSDIEGLLWVQVSFPGGSVTTLRAVSPLGRIIADVSIPCDLQIFEIGSNYVLGASEDRMDEPHVVVYALHPTPA
jgi:hypothetical protein